MNELIPISNNKEIGADKESVPLADTEAMPLAPDAFTLENIKNNLGEAIDAAPDYPSLIEVIDEAVNHYGHQTVLTVLGARFNADPSLDNKYCLDMVSNKADRDTVSTPESLEDLDFEGLSELLEVINQFSSEEIAVVAGIGTPEEAFTNPERKRMKDTIAPVYKLACKLRWETKAYLDSDKTKYPEFWQIFDKYEALHRAVGIINMKDKNVRHDLTVKL